MSTLGTIITVKDPLTVAQIAHEKNRLFPCLDLGEISPSTEPGYDSWHEVQFAACEPCGQRFIDACAIKEGRQPGSLEERIESYVAEAFATAHHLAHYCDDGDINGEGDTLEHLEFTLFDAIDAVRTWRSFIDTGEGPPCEAAD
jgi:hypothetical protein